MPSYRRSSPFSGAGDSLAVEVDVFVDANVHGVGTEAEVLIPLQHEPSVLQPRDRRQREHVVEMAAKI
jgi:hypothetical protein